MSTKVMDSADLDDGVSLGDGTTVWHLAQVRGGAQLGENCVIGRGAYIGSGVVMGDNCKVQNYALLYEPAVLGAGVMGAQIAAHASNQSQVVGSREELDEAFRELDAKFTGVRVPRPRAWGGWRLQPHQVEFWQGQPNRFHDRVRYVKDGTAWRTERLAP